MKTLTLFLLMTATLTASAQSHSDEHPWTDYLYDVMTADDAESDAWEQTYDLLCELEQQPLDINRATREQLEQLPFLSQQQIEDISEYLYRYGPMKSTAELMMIRSLDYAQRRLLTYFIYIDEEKAGEDRQRQFRLSDIAKYGKSELTATVRVPLYRRKGDDDGYLGAPNRHWLRYQLTCGQQLKAGILGAQDAGEPFFAGRNRLGYDHYALYLQLRDIGRIETLVAGHYRASMGMGLVMNSDFSLGKVALLQNLGRTAHSLRAHSSRSTNYLQGAGATIKLGKGIKATALVSYRAIDATLNDDGSAATLLTTGYHRTTAEMEKKHNTRALKTGGSIAWRHNGLNIGLNALYTRLSRPLRPNTATLYRRHYPQGTDFLNASIGYGYTCHRLTASGETATDKHGHLATINTLSLQLADTWSLTALQRFYSYAYQAPDAQSYADGGRVQNESGLYIGTTWQPTPRLRLAYYIDYAYFAWARYLVSQSSYSLDQLLQTTLQHRRWTFSGRYRLKMRQRDNEDKTALDNRWEHRARLTADYQGDSGLSCRTQIDGTYNAYGERQWGAMASQSLRYERQWLRLQGGIGYFHTDGYDSRLYLYESSPLYTYGIAQFYGEGLRYWLMARTAIGRHWTLTLKAGVTNYFDRSHTGTGLQQTNGSSQADIDLQLRLKF